MLPSVGLSMEARETFVSKGGSRFCFLTFPLRKSGYGDGFVARREEALLARRTEVALDVGAETRTEGGFGEMADVGEAGAMMPPGRLEVRDGRDGGSIVSGILRKEAVQKRQRGFITTRKKHIRVKAAASRARS